ncbi:hypothetical protein LguiA_020157 [Lonicera macranthoides]
MELKMQEMEASQKRMDEMLKTLMEQISNGGHMVLRPWYLSFRLISINYWNIL